MNSAFALPHGEPTGCGRAASRRIHFSRFAGATAASNFASSFRCAAELSSLNPRIRSPAATPAPADKATASITTAFTRTRTYIENLTLPRRSDPRF